MSGEDLRILGTTNAIKNNGNAGARSTKLSEKEQAAIELLNQIAGKKGYETSMTTSELEKELKKDLKALHSRRSRDDKRRGVDSFGRIDDSEYQTALRVLENQMAVREAFQQGSAVQLVQKFAGMTRHLVGEGDLDIDITNPNHVRGFVGYALEEEYKNGKISEEQYKAAKKYAETKGVAHFFKSFGRGITGSTNQSTLLFKNVGQNNNVAQIRQSEEGPQYEEKLQQKLDAAGISDELIYQIGDNLVGSEAVVSYSNKKVQAGEAQFITDELNKYARANGSNERFTVDEAKEIMKGAGYGIEKKIDAGKVIRDAVLPGAIGVAAGLPIAKCRFNEFSKIDVNNAGYGDIHKYTVSSEELPTNAPLVTGILATALGAISSMKLQAARVEDKAIPVQIDSDIKSFQDYADFVVESESFPTKEAKSMALQIAAYYVDKEGNLLKDQLIDAYRHAGGSADVEDTQNDDNRDASVLNHREALALLTKLESGEIKVVIDETEPEIEPEDAPNYFVHLQTEIEETTTPTDCYKVQSGDDWTKVIQNVYDIDNWADIKHIVRQVKDAYFEEMKAKGTLPAGVTKSTDAFFPKVGEDLCLPATVLGKDGKTEYTLNVNAEFDHGKASKDYKGVSYKSTSNPFAKTERSEFYIVNTHDNEKLPNEKPGYMGCETYSGSNREKAIETVEEYENRYGIKRTESEYVNGVRTK